MRTRLALAALAALALGAPAFAATTINDPVAFVRGVYQKLATQRAYNEPEDIYTPRLAALMALEKKEAGDEVGRLDFDFWVNAQDWTLKDVKVSGKPVEGAKDREIVTAAFRNDGRPERIVFYFEKTRAGWQLDDAESINEWTLSLILKYGWTQHEPAATACPGAKH